jgi:hypothetical protein
LLGRVLNIEASSLLSLACGGRAFCSLTAISSPEARVDAVVCLHVSGGVIPHIHKSLISKGPKAKKAKKNRPE